MADTNASLFPPVSGPASPAVNAVEQDISEERLAPIRHLLDTREWLEAEKQIRALGINGNFTPAGPLLNLHLRALIGLMENHWDVCDTNEVAKLLAKLSPASTALEPEPWQILQGEVNGHIALLQTELSENDTDADSLVLLSRLLPLATDFPVIYLMAAETGCYLLEQIERADKKERPADIFTLHRGNMPDVLIRHMQLKLKQHHVSPVFASSNAGDIQTKVQEYLLNAARAENSAFAVRARAAQLLGAFAMREARTHDALSWYTIAQDYGVTEVADKIAEAERIIHERLQVTLLETIDVAITGQKAETTGRLLNELNQLAPSAAITVRLGDYALIHNDFVAAEGYYHRAIATPDGTAGTLSAQQISIFQEKLASFTKKVSALQSPPYLRFNIDPHNIYLRATVGLLCCAQQRNELESARTILERMITAGLNSSGDDSLTQLEMLQREFVLWETQVLRDQAQKAIQLEEWSLVYESLIQLASMGNYMTEDDLAWLVIAIQKLGHDHTQVSALLAQIQPATFLRLPPALALGCLDWLGHNGMWKEANRYACEVPKLLPDQVSWHKNFADRFQQWTQEQIQRATEDLTARHFGAMRARLDMLLQTQADHPQARLLLAQLYQATNDFSRARQLLNSLLYDASVGTAAIVSLAEIEIALGNIPEANKLLNRLSGLLDQVQNEDAYGLEDHTINALINQLNERPCILSLPLDESVNQIEQNRATNTTFVAIFGVRILSAWVSHDGQSLPDTQEATRKFLLTISQGVSENLKVNFSWRYIGNGNTITITLLCRCVANTQSEAAVQAEELWTVIKQVLPHQDELFSFEPIWDEIDLQNVLAPFNLQGGYEIARRERIHNAGRGDGLYMVQTATTGFGLWRAIFALNGSKIPCAIDLHYAPTIMTDTERAKLVRLKRQEKQQESDFPSAQTTNKFRPAFPAHLLQRPGELCFTVQIQVATASASLGQELAALVSVELFGGDGQVIPAKSRRELEILRHNFEVVACEPWAEGLSPIGLERMRRLFTVDEAVILARLPAAKDTEIPGLPKMAIRSRPLPLDMPKQGVIIAESLAHSGRRRTLIRMTEQDRLRHTYVLGRTGTGKSTLLLNMALQDIDSGRGVAVVDPHSQLIDQILERIPAHRRSDVVVFDPSDVTYPLAYNIMDVASSEEANAVIADLVATFVKLYDPHQNGIVGPRFENIIRNTMLALFEAHPGATLVDVMHFVLSRSFRDEIIKRLDDGMVKAYWQITSPNIGEWGERSGGEVVDWVISKFSVFINDLVLRPIVGQAKSTLNLREIMDSGKILLIDLGKGKIGPQVSQFLGLIMVSGIFLAGLSRSKQDDGSYPVFYVYIDEFQNITTSRATQMFSEVRKFGLALTVANQHFSQLTEEIRQSITGNVANWLVFQVGVDDSQYLTSELYPTQKEELINLPSYHMIVKLLANGNFTTPFPVRTLPNSRVANPEVSKLIRVSSRQKYARHVAFVDREIRHHFRELFAAKS